MVENTNSNYIRKTNEVDFFARKGNNYIIFK